MNIQKNKTLLLLSAMLLLVGAFASAVLFPTPARAGVSDYQTPTPDAKGNIYYEVQAGDFCTNIFLKTNVPIAEIIRLNNLTEACVIQPGQKLLIGTGTPSQDPTPVPTVGPTPLPTPTDSPAAAQAGFASVCVVLFHDRDGNGMRTEGEGYLYGGMASINDRLGQISLTGQTVAGSPDTVEPFCFKDIPAGSYNITVAIPDGFNATTITNYALEVKAGEKATIDFGAQEAIATQNEESNTSQRSPVFAIVGLIILLAGFGLGIYLWRSNRA